MGKRNLKNVLFSVIRDLVGGSLVIKQQNNNIFLISQIWSKTKIKQHILSRLICIKWYFDNMQCLSSVYFN